MNNKKSIWMVIFIVIIIVTGVIVLLSIGNNQKNQGENLTNQESISNQGNLSNSQLVSDANYKNDLKQTSYIDDFGKEHKIEDIKLPYINLDSEDAKKVNDEIEKLYQDFIKKFQENINILNQGKMTDDFATNYNTYINENTLSIVIDITYDERLYKDYYTYNLDLKTLRLLSYEDVYKRAGFTEDNISERVDDSIKNLEQYKMNKLYSQNEKDIEELKECIQNTVDSYNNKSLKYIRSDMESEYYLKYYLDKDGKLNIIIYFAVPADTGYRIDTIMVS